MARIAAAPDTWMPLWIGAYLANTLHLNRAQHGSYMSLIMACWKAGGRLPANDATLATIAKCSDREWKAERATFAAFFDVDPEWWTHPRVMTELAKAAAFMERQSQNGAKGGRPRKPTETQTKPKPEPKPIPQKTTSPSPSPTPSRGEPLLGSPPEDQESCPIAARATGLGADAHDIIARIAAKKRMPE